MPGPSSIIYDFDHDTNNPKEETPKMTNSTGPHVPKNPYGNHLMFIGEMLHKEDIGHGALSLRSPQGVELCTLAEMAGLNYQRVYRTNVFLTQAKPDSTNVMDYFTTDQHSVLTSRPIKKNFRLHKDFVFEMNRLYKEIVAYRPRLIVACGHTAHWALEYQENLEVWNEAAFLTGICGKVRSMVIGNRLTNVLTIPHPGYFLHERKYRGSKVNGEYETLLDFKRRMAQTLKEAQRHFAAGSEPTSDELLDYILSTGSLGPVGDEGCRVLHVPLLPSANLGRTGKASRKKYLIAAYRENQV